MKIFSNQKLKSEKIFFQQLYIFILKVLKIFSQKQHNWLSRTASWDKVDDGTAEKCSQNHFYLNSRTDVFDGAMISL